MIALVSALIGFLSSAVPDLLKLFRDGKDRAHEITLLKLQMEYDAARQRSAQMHGQQLASLRLEAVETAARVAEEQILNERVKESLTGIMWVDALAGAVRPLLTFAFFGLYGVVKYAQFYLLLHPALPWQNALNSAEALVYLWSEEDIAIFSAVIAFWFGQRTMIKAKR